ncbi:Alpha-amylase 1 [Amphibalanus amphitrite]|uniref:Alpha-amylase n=1 Tax=Amphibalanus amphitrite TaxID=1232801 RepID=A0A6A4VJE9_AMPAM|nr:Alpha-amylase 1 [Amphibalanus amphitrite]
MPKMPTSHFIERMWSPLVALCLSVALLGPASAQFQPHCDDRQVIVHLFEWKWTDIAAECERYLAGAGYCGVQVSPPNEHVLVTGDGGEYPHPWWDRYQPVSYRLESRSGSEDQFRDMVARCNAVGVRIYVDAVLNHMAGLGRSGQGIAGSSFNSDDHDFPAVPYTVDDFNPRSKCPSTDGNVNNYSDMDNVKNCTLVGLTDLDQSLPHTQERIVDYLNRLVDMGVSGFRFDASKHMWPDDLAVIIDRLNNVGDSKPFIFHEVIDRNDGAVTVQQYYDIGRPTEFRYPMKIAWGIKDFNQLSNVVDYGWGMAESDKAFVFVDNHDTQRGHAGNADVITHQTPKEYKQGVAFMLAYPYGFTRVMSSYYFGDDTDQGPPHNDDWSTADVVINDDGSCGGGWVCEHRWPAISNMVTFRNAVTGTEMANYWNNGQAVAFSRDQVGFFAMAKGSSMHEHLQTGLPAGSYCNLIDDCATTVQVNGDGTADINIDNDEEPILAICVGCGQN